MLAQVTYLWILSGTIVIGASAVALALYIAHGSKRELAYREEAEEALRKSEERFRTLFEVSPDGVLIDQKGSLIYANPAYQRMFGISDIQSRIGMPYEPIIDSEDIERVLAISAAREAGEPAPTNYEYTGRREDGTLFPVAVTAAPFVYNGRPATMAILRDVSERKQAEEALRESEKKYRSLFDNMRSGFAYCQILVDESDQPVDFIYREVNDAFESHTGLKKSDVIGKRVTEVIPGIREAHPELLDIYGKVAATGESTHFEIHFKPLEIWLSIAVYRPQQGYFVAVFENIADRKRAEDELRQSHDELRSLSAHLQSMREEERSAVAREIHDVLGQALTALQMDLFWLRNKLSDGDKSLLDKIDSMSSIANESLLATQRISTELRPELLDTLGLGEAIKWQIEEFQKRTAIDCKVTIESADAVLDQDRSIAIYRILQESLTNVARHADATKVGVSLSEQSGALLLTVDDNGKGITRQQLDSPLSMGLIGMRERLYPWGGQVEIKGRKGQGTTLAATVPLIDG